MEIDPYGTFSLGKLIAAVAVVAVVTVVCVATAGTAAAVIAPTATAVVVKATAAAGVIAGTVTIADQLIEHGDVVDIDAVAANTYEKATGVAIDTLTSGASAIVKVLGTAIKADLLIDFNTARDTAKGQDYDSAKDYNTKEFIVGTLLSYSLDKVVFPHAMDLLMDIGTLIFPNEN